MTETLRVLQLTDPHLFADRAGVLRDRNSFDTLSDAVAHYDASGWTADLVYLTGDLVQDDSRGAYRNLREIIDAMNLPVQLVPGNHDVPELVAQELGDYVHCGSLERAGWQLIGIDSQDPGRASGRIGETELARLDRLLAGGDAPVAIFLHHPPVDLGSVWLDGVGLDDRDAFLELVRGYPRVKLIVFGHVHQAYDNRDEMLRILGTPSTTRQFLPGAREFAVDDQPPAYRRLEFDSDGRFTTELVWVENA